MKILFVGIYSNPVNKPIVPFNEDLCRKFVSCGHEVIFVGIGDGISFPEKKEHSLRNKTTPGFKKETNISKKIINYISVAIQSFLRLLLDNPDVVYVFSTPPFFVYLVTLISRIKKFHIIYDIQDLYPEILRFNLNMKKESFVYQFLETIERKSLERCSIIRVISTSMRETIQKRSKTTDNVVSKIILLPNWISSSLENIEILRNTIKQPSQPITERLTFEYSGNIGYGQGLENIFEVAKEVPQHMFVIRGEGTGKERIILEMRRQKLNNLFIEDFLPYEEYLKRLLQMNVVPLLFLKKNIGLYSIPSKALVFIKARKQAIYFIDRQSELARIVAQNNIGFVVDPTEPQRLKFAVLSMQKRLQSVETGFEKLNFLLSKENVLEKYCNQIHNLKERQY